MRDGAMFERIDIRLAGPICSCEEQDLGWGIRLEDKGAGLEITCRKCGTRLIVPHSKFGAAFVLRVPYPGAKSGTKVDGSSRHEADGKVIHLFPKGKNPKE